MSLREYQHKRHFRRTPEPKGTRKTRTGRIFIVQKHAARNLHYDFRLELDGVLKSWAVPKGPCLDPAVKRLAMHVEDHPIEYASFEGVIPQGEYGGGTVMLWDRGEWEPVGDPEEGYRAGKLKFKLHGQKLHGGWMLLRTGQRAHSGRDRQWLLFKERDEEARPISEENILEELPLSVSSGRNMPDIAADRDRVWGRLPKLSGNGKALRSRKAPARPQRSPRGKRLPSIIDVELATRADRAPAGEQWVHEVKFDGYRILCRLDGGHVTLLSRNHKDWTERFAFLADAMRNVPARQAVFDGEIVALRSDGVSDFQQLQNAAHERGGRSLHYFIFDLLYLDGRDLTKAPLAERKEILAKLLTMPDIPPSIHLSEHVEGNGPIFFREACKNGLEGIVSKRRDRPYRPGRGTDWLKIKCVQTEEFVIGGYTDPAGQRLGFGALLVGYHNPKGDLVYAGKVGTGYDERTLKRVMEKLQTLRQEASPFQDYHRAPKGTHWVSPALVAQVAFGSRTRDGILRHASFQGLREDKTAEEVTHEKTLPLKTILGNNKAKPMRSRADRTAAAVIGPAYDPARQQYAGVRFTNPEKVLYPEQGITKLELANYYRFVAEWMLPHVASRPLVLFRCPEGRSKPCFFQKHPGLGTPTTLRHIPIKEKRETRHYVIVDDAAGLISLAQMGALEIHAWGSHADNLERPDRLIFDLDPDPEVPWERVVQAARQLRQFLHHLGLESLVKTTGGKGLHLVVPVEPQQDWEEAKSFCKEVAGAVVRADPGHFTANMSKAARHGKIFIDYLRNGRGATAIVPYSTRARAGAPVSTPLTWEELSPRVRSDHYTIKNLPKRLAALKRDPWHAIDSIHQTLAHSIQMLRALMGS